MIFSAFYSRGNIPLCHFILLFKLNRNKLVRIVLTDIREYSLTSNCQNIEVDYLMRQMKRSLLSYLLMSLMGLGCTTISFSQNIYNTIISGHVTDAKTREPIPFTTVSLENTDVGTRTNEKGYYKIVTGKTSYKVTFSFLGYTPESRVVSPGKAQVIDVELTGTSVELSEVQVKASRRKYTNRNNPAVELISKVIGNKSLNRKENLEYFNYDKYEKVVFSLSNIGNRFEQLKTFRKFNFIFENVDTSRIAGKDDLPLYIKEKESSCFFRKDPKAKKEVIHGEKTINFTEYVDSKGFAANISYLYQNIDIYDNEIFFLSNKFLSPLASTAPLLYRYFINDSTEIDGVKCIKLFFEPRNPADFLFHGFLFIDNDGSYAVRKVDMSFNKRINIDWIKDVRIIQDFDKIDGKTLMLTNDEISVEFGVTQNLPGVLGHRIITYNNYQINKPITDSTFSRPEIVSESNSQERNETFWQSVRKPPLNIPESNLYGLVDSVKKIPAFKRDMNIIMLISTDFLNLGKVEIGPGVSFLSFNPIEGTRFRFGGRTTQDFNKTIYFESYLAYGTLDRQFKYNFVTTYSILNTSIYRFPVRSIRLSYQYDTEIPGQKLIFSSPDNLFYSLKRGVNDKMVYNRVFSIEYLHEFMNHFSFDFGYAYKQQVPAGNLYYTVNPVLPLTNDVRYLKISETFVNLRYAPKEEFYQGKVYRSRVPSRYPILQFSYTLGSKLLANSYNYQKVDIGITKRFYLSIIGYTDVTAEAGKIFGDVPFPLLFIHNANQSYAYQSNSFNMMNFMEFVSDKYVSLQIDHSFNGFFFNKVPLLKRMKLREVASFKAIYGEIGTNNNPDFQPGLFKFPVDNNGIPLTFSLGKKPYIEGSVGVSNLFRVLRVDLVKRFTYLQNPNVTSFGVRVLFKLDF